MCEEVEDEKGIRCMWGVTRCEGWVVKWFVMLFNMVWRVGVALIALRKARLIPIYKKGIRLECSNYRGIHLLSVVEKVYARVLNDRVKLMTADTVMDEQGGFRAGRRCHMGNICPLHIELQSTCAMEVGAF